MIKYKMLALDLDGTILHNEKISESVQKAIQDAINKGVRVVFATGRTHSHMKHVYEMLSFHDKTDQLHISNNGTVIATPQGKIFSIFQPNKDHYLELIDRLEAKEVYFNVATALKSYTNKKVTLFDYEEGMVEQIDDLKTLVSECTRVAAVVDNCKIVEEAIEGLDFEYANSYERYYDIWPTGIDKGVALQKLASHYNIDMKEVMAMGDSDNDLGMFRVAGFSLAMGQGSEMAKTLASDIAPSVEEDGVAWAIKKYIL